MNSVPCEGYSRLRREVSQEYGRILTAAVISAQFRQMLLKDPAKAIAAGFAGEKFNLENDERSRVASIRATSLADFATQLNCMGSGAAAYSAMAAD